MKAIVQEGSGSADALHVRDIETPALAEDRVLIKVYAASVNAADWHTIHGGALLTIVGTLMGGRRRDTVKVAGGDVAGRVEAVGANVTGLKPGDEVFGTGQSTFAEYALSRPRVLAPKPAALSFVQAGAMGIAGITALQGLRDKGQVGPGKRVLIYGGGGGVGSFAVQIAKALGAHVTAVTSARNLDLIRTLGPDELVDFQHDDALRHGAPFDVVFDVAASRPLGSLLRLLTPTGTLVLAGASKSGGMIGILARIAKARILSRFSARRIVFYVARIDHDDLAYLAQLVEAGRLCPLIDRTYPLDEAREAVRYLGTGTARGKVVIEVASAQT